jgi:hypothetical protein
MGAAGAFEVDVEFETDDSEHPGTTRAHTSERMVSERFKIVRSNRI